MVQPIPATEVTLRALQQALGLQQAQDPTFFSDQRLNMLTPGCFRW